MTSLDQQFKRKNPYRHLLDFIPKKPHRFIEPTYSSSGISPIECDYYVIFIENILQSLLSEELIEALRNSQNAEAIKEQIALLNLELPLLLSSTSYEAPCTLSFSLLCPSEYTSGVGRYTCDALCRWLVPGKLMNISSVRSLNFNFSAYPDKKLYFHQILIDVETEEDLAIIKNNWHHLQTEIRLSILSVRHARYITSLKKLSSEQKKTLIEENLAAVIDISKKNDNVFNHMHHFLLQLSAEDKVKQIKEYISPFINQRQKTYDRDMFLEVRHSILLFGDRFTAIRDLRHVSRLISYLFLFRKTLNQQVVASPDERHLSLKILKTQLHSVSQNKNRNILGIVGGMNLLRDNELFEERHIMEAIIHTMPQLSYVSDSLIIDRRSHDPIRLFYFEIEKNNGTAFSLDEMKMLKKELPRQLKDSVENVLHPVLMPRNEEEVMRNILLLSQQLKLINDLPQVTISYNMQTEEDLLFTVILLRIYQEGYKSIETYFKDTETDLVIHDIEIKKVGLVRKKYQKEANVFKVGLNKKKYIRKDFTIDLFKARQEVSSNLHHIFGGIRDFNGGILSKQQEVFQELRNLVQDKTTNKDFLLENFFYSLTPPLRQTLISPHSLQLLFALLQEALEVDYKSEMFALKVLFEKDQLLVLAASSQPYLKDELFSLITKLQIPSAELSYIYVQAYGINCIGYIYQNPDANIRNFFYSTLLSCLQEWKSRIKK